MGSEKTLNKNIFSVCIILIVIVFAVFVFTGISFGNQARSAMYPKVVFSGSVKIGDGDWFEYVKGQHISSNRGDVVFKGYFELVSPDDGTSLGRPQAGTPLAFYFNHIGGYISEDGGQKHIFDVELDYAGEDMCGVMYVGYDYMGGEEVTITLSNPHKYGNSRAVDDFLDNLSVYGGSQFEKDVMNKGNPQRNCGIILIISAFMILGTAIFSMLIHLKVNKNLWLVGFGVLFGGIYFVFSAYGVAFRSEILKYNTRILGASMMAYMLCVEALIVSGIRQPLKKAGRSFMLLSILLVIFLMLLPLVSGVKFYDTWVAWTVFQCIASVVMLCFLIHGFVTSEKGEEIIFAFGMLPVIGFIIDAVSTYVGWWEGGVVSSIILLLLFFVAVVFLLTVIPKNINAANMAQELETERNILKAELAESRIAIMISQIQPHFIYNTLGTIEQLCISDPASASKLVRNFSLYLRGNFSELDNIKPIRFSKEMEHVKHYTDIEQVRFPDMTIHYDLRFVDFVLPALSVQPLVENAIKHGLMGLEEGGAVKITAYETDTHYVVEVKDNGVGFDTNEGYDEAKHVGIKNIRGRIEAMCGGSLCVESKVGVGTTATLKIAKEAEN